MNEGLPQNPKTSRSTALLIAGFVAAIVLVGAASFVGGMQYSKLNVSAFKSNNSNTNQYAGGGPDGNMQVRMLGGLGTVTAVSSSEISIEDFRGSGTTTYTISSNTKVSNNNSTISASDIKVGDRVSIRTAS